MKTPFHKLFNTGTSAGVKKSWDSRMRSLMQISQDANKTTASVNDHPSPTGHMQAMREHMTAQKEYQNAKDELALKNPHKLHGDDYIEAAGFLRDHTREHGLMATDHMHAVERGELSDQVHGRGVYKT